MSMGPRCRCADYAWVLLLKCCADPGGVQARTSPGLLSLPRQMPKWHLSCIGILQPCKRFALSAVHPACSSSRAQTLQDNACSADSILHSMTAEGKSCNQCPRIRSDNSKDNLWRSNTLHSTHQAGGLLWLCPCSDWSGATFTADVQRGDDRRAWPNAGWPWGGRTCSDQSAGLINTRCAAL